MRPIAYGAYSALALDPIEKKPFRRFYPGSSILSIGGYGCNMRCWFCQNSGISQSGPPPNAQRTSPALLVRQARELIPAGNIGIAFTYNEPGVTFEFVRDTAECAREAGLKNAMVTNGYLNEGPWRELLARLDGLNIDLKCFSEEKYRELGGGLREVQRSIALAVERAHVEITTLVVPGFSDDPRDMDAQAKWIASLSPEIPLHISRYYPRYHAAMPPTDVDLIYRLANIARGHLEYVYEGNC